MPKKTIFIILGLVLGIALASIVKLDVFRTSAQSQKSFNLKDAYPMRSDITLVYQQFTNGVPNGTFARISHEPWPDGKHFTVHHTYAKGEYGTAKWCPRIDDVFVWRKNKLYYTSTIDFFKGTKTSLDGAGHLWGSTSMSDRVISNETHPRNVFDGPIPKGATCAWDDSRQSLRFSQTDRSWQGMIFNQQTWSPYTGGASVYISTYRLDETTFFNKDADDQFKEEWFFYDDPKYGYIPISTRGYRKEKGSSDFRLLWDNRLWKVEIK